MSPIEHPAHVLVATDLSARCDRALDRAALLARGWSAALTVVHALSPAEAQRHERGARVVPSWRRPQDLAHLRQRRLRSDLAAERIAADAFVRPGMPADVVLDAVGERRAGLVVLGFAKDAPLERIQLGSTVDALVRRSRVPVLNVRVRGRAPYRHVVVATDFSAPSAQALRLAADWFPEARLTVFHAHHLPGGGLVEPATARDAGNAAAAGELDRFLGGVALGRPVDRLVEAGDPCRLLAEYVASDDVDLVALGSQGRSGLARALLGSTAEHLLHVLDCDTLVVRPG